jgi:hypothetical protein
MQVVDLDWSHPARKLVPKPWLVTVLVTGTGGEKVRRAGMD